VAIA
jgi:WD40 repeat protein